MTTLVPSPVLNNEILILHQQRLYRIVEECLDVSFILCNNELEEFRIAKVFDVFDQTITTAFVLNTGFWPFYNTTKGQSICVCGRYGVPCRHYKNVYHWLDLDPVPKEETRMFYPVKHNTTVHPLEYNIQIQAVNEEFLGYEISIYFKLFQKKAEKPKGRGRQEKYKKKEDVKVEPKDIFQASFRVSYNLVREYYPAFFTIVFQPNPCFHEHYGSYFNNLLEQRASYQWPINALSDIQQYFTVPINHMPTTSLVLRNVNLPLYALPTQLCAIFPQLQTGKVKYQRVKRNKSVQTPWILDNNIQSCGMPKAEDAVQPKWNNNYDLESYHSIVDSLRHIGFVLQEKEDTKTEVSTDSLDNSDPYDNQLPVVGFDKTVKNCQPDDKIKFLEDLSLWTDSLEIFEGQKYLTINDKNSQMGIKRKSSVLFDSPNIQAPKVISPRKTINLKHNSYSRALYSNGAPSIDSIQAFPYLSEEVAPSKNDNNILNYSEALKKPLEFKKSEMIPVEKECYFKVPRMPVATTRMMTKSEIDEEFEIIEAVLDDDVASNGDDKTLHWWNAVKMQTRNM